MQVRKSSLYLITLVVFALATRLIYPALFMTGGDLPGHIMASLRLSQTSPFIFSNLLENTFAQMFQFSHGYTTLLLPFILYTILFNIFELTLNESNLVLANSFLGIASLLSIYYFLKVHTNKKTSLLALLLFSILPIHIGLSRAHVGTQIIQSIFFFLSLSFLSRFLAENKRHLKLIYFVLTTLYIGADNLFFVGLFFHLVFVYIYVSDCKKENFIQNCKKLYLNYLTLFFIILPFVIYVFVTIYTINQGFNSGFILRTIWRTTQEGSQRFTFNPYVPLRDSLELIGPIFIVFIASLIKIKEILRNKILKFFSIYFFVYFILMVIASSTVERNYVMFLIVPSVVIPLVILSEKKYFPVLYIVVILLTLFYAASVVYGLDIGFNTTSNYGSVNKGIIKDNDYGIKTLGYLTRSGEIIVSKINSQRYGFEIKEVGVFLSYEGAYYYLGNLPVENQSELQKFDKFIVVYFEHWKGDNNQDIPTIAREMNLNITGYIYKGDLKLATIYSNDITTLKYYDANLYNEKFDKSFGSIDELVKISLGHY